MLPPNSFYVVSYPRSGNTWLINCLSHLLDGVAGEAYTPFKLYTELHGLPTAGFHFWCEPRSRPDQPICVKSHDNLQTFRQRHPPAPVVYIARDARDSLLSYYFFRQAYAKAEELDTQKIHGTAVLISRGTSDPIFDAADFAAFLTNEAPAWAAHVLSAQQDGDLCFLTYEELTRNFDQSLRRVLTHVRLPAARTIKETHQVYHTGFRSVFSGNSRDFFRRGQIGDWKNWFEADHAQLIDQLIGPHLLALGFEKDPAWARKYHRNQPAQPT